jgi:hypothetical protein
LAAPDAKRVQLFDVAKDAKELHDLSTAVVDQNPAN